MGMKQDMDELMNRIKVTEEMHQMIMEGKNLKNHRKFSLKKAAIPAAAALLAGSTLYVGAGYIMERFPLREFFVEGNLNVVTVPESQRMPEIYNEIVDSSQSVVKDVPEKIEDGNEPSSDGENTGAEVSMGKYGELIIDNDLFSIELLENICTGRELSLSYILTYKTDQHILMDVSVGTEYYGEMLDGPSDEPVDSSRLLLDSAFGDYIPWNRLPENCMYELEKNQELCNYTLLAKEDISSGIYYLYAEYFIMEEPDVVVSGMDADTENISLQSKGDDFARKRMYFKAPIEIIGNDNYGIALSGTTDKTEGDVHFDTYEVYVSPWNVYLTLEGTYQGEISAIWGAKSSHEIAIEFKDGTKAYTTVRLTGMGYGFGDIDVNMRASFDTSIDPETISGVTLDGVVIMGK